LPPASSAPTPSCPATTRSISTSGSPTATSDPCAGTDARRRTGPSSIATGARASRFRVRFDEERLEIERVARDEAIGHAATLALEDAAPLARRMQVAEDADAHSLILEDASECALARAQSKRRIVEHADRWPAPGIDRTEMLDREKQLAPLSKKRLGDLLRIVVLSRKDIRPAHPDERDAVDHDRSLLDREHAFGEELLEFPLRPGPPVIVVPLDEDLPSGHRGEPLEIDRGFMRAHRPGEIAG